MAECKYCKGSIPQGADKCPHCGAPAPITTTTSRQVTVQYQPGQQPQANPPKEYLVTLILCIFLGSLGVHRFYVGRTGGGIGLLLLTIIGWCTLWFFGIGLIFFVAVFIWWLIDIIAVASGKFTDKWGRPLQKT